MVDDDFFMPVRFAEHLQEIKSSYSIDEFDIMAESFYAVGDRKQQAKLFTLLKTMSLQSILHRCGRINRLSSMFRLVKGNCNALQSTSASK
jgi:hypothetical protein